MPLSKAMFRSPDPLNDEQLLKALGAMSAEHTKVVKKYEAQKGALKVTREDRDDLSDRIQSALAAREAGNPVWLLKNGRCSTEGPDGQGVLVEEPARPGDAWGDDEE